MFQILKFQFWLVKNSTKFEWKIFFLNICQKCVIWSQKTCCWCQANLKFCIDANCVVLKKTRQNNFSAWAEQHGQNGIWNLEIFVEYFHRLKYLICLSEAGVQLVPTILFTSCLQNAWIATDSLAIFTAAVDCGQLVPKYKSKVNLSSWRSPNISVWNNWTARKWGLWWESGSNL